MLHPVPGPPAAIKSCLSVFPSPGPASSSVGSCWPANSTPAPSPATQVKKKHCSQFNQQQFVLLGPQNNLPCVSVGQSVPPVPESAYRGVCVDGRRQRDPAPAPAGTVSRYYRSTGVVPTSATRGHQNKAQLKGCLSSSN